MKLYKFLKHDGSTPQGFGQWPVDNIETWMPTIEGDLVPCVNGYHLLRDVDLINWPGPVLWECEHRGEIVGSDTKVVVRDARLTKKLEAWNDRTARLFACDCAERALKRVDRPDKRSLDAIEVARAFANGNATQEQLSAARSAAGDAAGYAAGNAAGVAAGAAAWYAAWYAAGDAAGYANWYAVGHADWYAERKWQTKHLLKMLGI